MGIFGRKGSNIRVAIDASPNAIRGLVFQIAENGDPRMLRKMIYKSPEGVDVKKIGVKLHEFVFELVKSLEQIPEKITVGVGPELGSQEIALLALEKPEGLKLSAPKSLEILFVGLFEQYQKTHNGTLAYPLEVLANGYSLKKFLQDIQNKHRLSFREITKNVQNLQFRVLCLHFGEDTGASLFDMRKSLGGMPVEFVPLSAAYGLALTKGMNITDAFCVAVGWEETTLFLIQDNVLVEILSFPLGERHCVRTIAKNLSISSGEAEDLKRQSAEYGLNSGAKVAEAVTSEIEKWKEQFIENLGIFYSKGFLPPKTFLFGVGAHLPQFADFLRTSGWIKGVSYVGQPELLLPEAQTLFGGNSFNGTLRGPEELPLGALVFYSLKNTPLFNKSVS